MVVQPSVSDTVRMYSFLLLPDVSVVSFNPTCKGFANSFYSGGCILELSQNCSWHPDKINLAPEI